jgi:hypothetical protein
MTVPVTLIKTIRTSTMSASLRSDGLLLLEVDEDTNTTEVIVKEAIEAIGKTAKGKCYPLLVISGKNTTIETAAMEYISKEGINPHSTAVAFLISSISQKLLGNFYLSFNRPKKPTRMFTSVDDAVAWLHGFKS